MSITSFVRTPSRALLGMMLVSLLALGACSDDSGVGLGAPDPDGPSGDRGVDPSPDSNPAPSPDADPEPDADPGPDGEPAPMPGQLTASEWRDLDHWGFWLDLIEPETTFGGMTGHWGLDTSQRFAALVIDGEGSPAIDATVELLDGTEAVVWEARTDNKGRAELFANVFEPSEGPYTLVATSGESRDALSEVLAFDGEPTLLTLAEPSAPEPVADIMFMIDTTGSMADELSFLQSELRNVIERASDTSPEIERLRLSANFYRDHGDTYLVRSHTFTENLDTVVGQIQGEVADGGGDIPEAVEVALADAINGHEWSPSARARIVFLLLDAPPHHTQQIVANLQSTLKEAARRGIRIIPIGASGVDRGTEFLVRFMDILTGGTYVFLTDDSGIGGDHLEPVVGETEVELLNDLLVRLLSDAMR